MTHQLSYSEQPAIIARDVAIAQVEANNHEWLALALLNTQNYLRIVKRDQEFTGEQLRLWLEPTIGKMPSAGCMGALTLQLIGKHIIEKTGRYAPMVTEKSHGRETKVYRFCAGVGK
jgi:hypothetical protein